MESLLLNIRNNKISYFVFLLFFFLITPQTKGQETEDLIPEFKTYYSLVQTFGFLPLHVKYFFPYELHFHSRLFKYRNEKVALGLNSMLIHAFGSEVKPIWFYHLGIIYQYHFLRKRRANNNEIHYSAYFEGGLNAGNYYLTLGDNDLFIPINKLALNGNIGIGVKQYLGKFLYLDYGVGFNSVIFKRLPEAHNEFGFYRIGLSRDLIFPGKKKVGSSRNTRSL
ncbi:MAG: hypothetical protein H0X62_05450 [Bacteroidetes bacterium]|nr:hypothetical protein [Bacteroidota bacterium]